MVQFTVVKEFVRGIKYSHCSGRIGNGDKVGDRTAHAVQIEDFPGASGGW